MASDLPRTTLEQWAALAAVVDRGSFEAAAEALDRSQSSVSYALKRLQEQLPVAVLESRGRRTLLTGPGELMLQRARSLLEEAKRLEHLAATLARGWEAEVRLAVEAVTPPELLMCSLARFGEHTPQTRVQLIESVLSGTCEALLQQRADLAVTVLAVARRDHPLHALGRDLGYEDLKHHRQLAVRDTGHYRQVDSGWLGADERWTVSHLRTAIAIIKRGLAYAWITRDYIEEELANGELRALPLRQGGTRQETLYLVYADPEGAGPATRTLGEMLVEQGHRRRRKPA